MDYLFSPPAQASVAIVGSIRRFPVHRIYCVGAVERGDTLVGGIDGLGTLTVRVE